MSNSKTAIAEIKKLMKQFGFMSDESVLKSFKLEDNSILETPELKVGEKITRLNDEFERVALENGEFLLQENFLITVEDGHIITVKEIFVDAKLVDGTKIKVEGDTLDEGAKVVVVTEDAELPAPDGVHELEDGTKVETKDGVIVHVEEVAGDVEEGETPEAPSVEIPSAMGEGEPAPEGEPEATVEKGVVEPQEEIMSLLKDFIVKCSDKMSEMEQKMESMKNDFNAFKKEPAAKKIANGKTDFNKTNNLDDVDEKIAMIMSLRKNNI